MQTLKLPLFLLLALVACRKDRVAPFNPDYFIVGSSAGMCMSGCTNLYKLSGGKLYPDSMERGLAPLVFRSTPLPEEQRNIVEKLKADFPEELYIGDADKIIGCPDCRDQGTYYIEFALGGRVFTVRMDTDEAAIPASLRPYHAEYADALNRLK